MSDPRHDPNNCRHRHSTVQRVYPLNEPTEDHAKLQWVMCAKLDSVFMDVVKKSRHSSLDLGISRPVRVWWIKEFVVGWWSLLSSPFCPFPAFTSLPPYTQLWSLRERCKLLPVDPVGQNYELNHQAISVVSVWWIHGNGTMQEMAKTI